MRLMRLMRLPALSSVLLAHLLVLGPLLLILVPLILVLLDIPLIRAAFLSLLDDLADPHLDDRQVDVGLELVNQLGLALLQLHNHFD